MARGRQQERRPDEVLRDLERELQGPGWPAGLTLLSGSDRYHLDRAQRTLLGALVPPDSSDFALSIFGGDRHAVDEVVAAARSRPMFAPRRVVLVRDAASLDGDPELLRGYAQDPPPHSYLLVRAPTIDRRRKLYQALGAGRELRLELPRFPDPRVQARLVAGLAAERGLRLAGDAAVLLAEVTGGDLYRAATELDKLAAWLAADGAAASATPEMVRDLASGSAVLSGWEVADAILRRDLGAALTAARNLLDGGEEPLRLVGGLAWRARSMLRAKALLEAGAGERQVLAAIRAWSYGRQLMDGLRRYTLDELLAFPGLLLRADRTLKSRGIDPRAVVESLVEAMTREPARRSAAG